MIIEIFIINVKKTNFNFMVIDLVSSNVYTFENWKEFSLEKPNEVFYNSLQNVLENTDLEGDLKHKKENVFKVFSLLITHNYGHLLYEIIHLFHYLLKCDLQ